LYSLVADGWQQTDDSGPENLTGVGHVADVDRGPLESVELLSDDRRREIAAKLAAACCEMALSLVYSDGSTQLREIPADAKVDRGPIINSSSDNRRINLG